MPNVSIFFACFHLAVAVTKQQVIRLTTNMLEEKKKCCKRFLFSFSLWVAFFSLGAAKEFSVEEKKHCHSVPTPYPAARNCTGDHETCLQLQHKISIIRSIVTFIVFF